MSYILFKIDKLNARIVMLEAQLLRAENLLAIAEQRLEICKDQRNQRLLASSTIAERLISDLDAELELIK